MEELKQWVTAFWKGGVQMSEDFAGLYRPSGPPPPPSGGARSTVIGAKSVATGYSIN